GAAAGCRRGRGKCRWPAGYASSVPFRKGGWKTDGTVAAADGSVVTRDGSMTRRLPTRGCHNRFIGCLPSRTRPGSPMTLHPYFARLALLVPAACQPDAPSSGAADRDPDQYDGDDILLRDPDVPHVVVAEAFVTVVTPEDNIASPASWLQDGRLLLAATAKQSDRLLVHA